MFDKDNASLTRRRQVSRNELFSLGGHFSRNLVARGDVLEEASERATTLLCCALATACLKRRKSFWSYGRSSVAMT